MRLKRNEKTPDEDDAKRLFELVGLVWRVPAGFVRAGIGGRGARGRNVACAILAETKTKAWRLCGYKTEVSEIKAKRAIVRYLDCPIDGARIHRLLALVSAEMPWLLEKLVVPEKSFP